MGSEGMNSRINKGRGMDTLWLLIYIQDTWRMDTCVVDLLHTHTYL